MQMPQIILKTNFSSVKILLHSRYAKHIFSACYICGTETTLFFLQYLFLVDVTVD